MSRRTEKPVITSGETGRERKPFSADVTESSISLRFSGRESPAGWIFSGSRRDSVREAASCSPISLTKRRTPFGGPEPSLLRIGAPDTMKSLSWLRKKPENPSPPALPAREVPWCLIRSIKAAAPSVRTGPEETTVPSGERKTMAARCRVSRVSSWRFTASYIPLMLSM
jgi:hypothetical protein